MEGDQEGRSSSAGVEGACVDSEESISSIEGLKNGLLWGCAVIDFDGIDDGILETSIIGSFKIAGG